jgi:hypothetical protein
MDKVQTAWGKVYLKVPEGWVAEEDIVSTKYLKNNLGDVLLSVETSFNETTDIADGEEWYIPRVDTRGPIEVKYRKALNLFEMTNEPGTFLVRRLLIERNAGRKVTLT